MFVPEPTLDDTRRASSRGIIPKAKVKTVKMTFIIVLGKYHAIHGDFNILFEGTGTLITNYY